MYSFHRSRSMRPAGSPGSAWVFSSFSNFAGRTLPGWKNALGRDRVLNTAQSLWFNARPGSQLCHWDTIYTIGRPAETEWTWERQQIFSSQSPEEKKHKCSWSLSLLEDCLKQNLRRGRERKSLLKAQSVLNDRTLTLFLHFFLSRVCGNALSIFSHLYSRLWPVKNNLSFLPWGWKSSLLTTNYDCNRDYRLIIIISFKLVPIFWAYDYNH